MKAKSGFNQDDAIKARVRGTDDLSKKYLGTMAKMGLIASGEPGEDGGSKGSSTPPADETIMTLWFGRVEEDIMEEDIRDELFAYGPITHIHILRDKCCAFVELSTREIAEAAAKQLNGSATVKGHHLSVSWAKGRQNAAVRTAPNANAAAAAVANAAFNAGRSYLQAPPGGPMLSAGPGSRLALPSTPMAPIALVPAAAAAAGSMQQQSTTQQRPPPPSGPPPQQQQQQQQQQQNGFKRPGGDMEAARPGKRAVSGAGVDTDVSQAYPSMRADRLGGSLRGE